MENTDFRIPCPYCAEKIQPNALKCKHCGEIIDEALRAQSQKTTLPKQQWTPGIAALLSFLLPGAGQIYKGNILSGMIWCLFTFLGYFVFVLPGLFLHIICIYAAFSGNPYKTE
jgi:TM2 domain-containing membrane protein YozV